ncbi:hypothetical protein BDM02DRAFT_3185240 [Thelephora ganbajun]|uniref:Uncharacterized protein n=1 Tax=Thelephora ganbajun TaxID=370292 RepID=A0ACB6ZLN9_THEGA|nr:hypothetical protein BDM02DRAFT_3185240 [Thelephora ganbajun]
MAQSIFPTYDASIEEDLRVLLGYDVVFLVDDVVSGTLRSSRIDVHGEKVGLRLKACFVFTMRKLTSYGVEEYLKNLRVDVVDYGEIKLAEGLENLLGQYMDTLVRADTNTKKCSFIAILGGRDERELQNVEKVLVSVAKRLDEGMYPPDQLGIQFFQISNDGES